VGPSSGSPLLTGPYLATFALTTTGPWLGLSQRSTFFLGNFQTVITWVFLKLFELCPSSKESSGSQLSDEYKNIDLRITPYDPMMILRRSAKKGGFREGHKHIWSKHTQIHSHVKLSLSLSLSLSSFPPDSRASQQN